MLIGAKKNGINEGLQNKTWREKAVATRRAIGALFLPVIILGGIYGGIFTPTEAGCVSCIYAVILAFIYRSIKIPDVFTAAIKTAKSTASIMIIIAFANVFAYLLSASKVPATLTNAVVPYFQGSTVLYMLSLMLILFIAGAVMETTAIILILGPILFPIGVAVGLQPLHLSVAFCCCLILGYATPPFGMSLFTTAGATKVGFGGMAREALPLVVFAFIACVIIALFPQLTMVFPDLAK